MPAFRVLVRKKNAGLFKLAKIRGASTNIFRSLADVEKISHIPTNWIGGVKNDSSISNSVKTYINI